MSVSFEFWRPFPWIVGLGVVIASASAMPVYEGNDTVSALEMSFSTLGLRVENRDVHIISGPSMFRGKVQGVVRARRISNRETDQPSGREQDPVRSSESSWEPCDIYYFRAQMPTERKVLGTPTVYNLTSTPAEEGPLVVSGNKVAFTVLATAGTIGVRVLDLSGERALQGDWSSVAKMQNAITNYQNTGQFKGVDSLFWAVDPPVDKATAGLTADGWLEVTSGSTTSRAPVGGGNPIGDFSNLAFRPSEKARPGNLVTWAVDRVRSMPWFGDNRMQMLKTVAFGAFDVYRRAETSVLGDSSEKEVAADFGEIASRNPPTTFTDPDTGWPPAPIEPFLRKPLEGEGKWIALENDLFIPVNPGVAPAFVTSFVRTDRDRSYTRIYVTLWDPRQVELHTVSGSVEPKGASGEAGPGMIPRKPEVMQRVVAGFNGGFQAMHGEWGMMGEGVMYLPPKPYAATVAESSNGDTLFGTWPNDETIPSDVIGYRQNLTPLVMDGKINPYRRTWWGGTPPEWEDRVNTTRTGICLTQEGFIAYFYGNEIDMMPLAQAMVQTRCQYGLHLDMNPGHTGLEFYTIRPTELLGDIGRPLDRKWEAQGKVPFMPGWSFRARRMVRFMGLMNFPRYIQREARDYFYLTLRHILPGEDIRWEGLGPEQGKWRTSGLPQHGFPYAVATTHISADAARPDAKVLLIKLDPRMLTMNSLADAQRVGQTDKPGASNTRQVNHQANGQREQVAQQGSGALVVTLSNADHDATLPTLWFSDRSATISVTKPQGAQPLVSGQSADPKDGSQIVAAIGISDTEGMIIYAEVQQQRQPENDGALLSSVLDKLGCSKRILLKKSLLPTFGYSADADREQGRTVRLYREQAPGAKRFFTDTQVVDPSEWQPLQHKRIRYFRKPKVQDN